VDPVSLKVTVLAVVPASVRAHSTLVMNRARGGCPGAAMIVVCAVPVAEAVPVIHGPNDCA
jgi:hypothetical protein